MVDSLIRHEEYRISKYIKILPSLDTFYLEEHHTCFSLHGVSTKFESMLASIGAFFELDGVRSTKKTMDLTINSEGLDLWESSAGLVSDLRTYVCGCESHLASLPENRWLSSWSGLFVSRGYPNSEKSNDYHHFAHKYCHRLGGKCCIDIGNRPHFRVILCTSTKLH